MNANFAALAAACAALAGPAAAAEITVMSGGAVRSAFSDASAAWERGSGHKVKATFAPAGDLRKKIAAGERTDIVIIPVENFAALEKDVPDISTADKLKSTLMAAKSVTYMDPERGTSGKHFDEGVLAKLGVRDEVRAKAKLGEGGYIAEKVASGEVEIAFHQMTEILPVQGITVVGLLPAELQKTTVYSGAVMKGARQPREAQALLDYLASPEGRKSFLDRGFTAP